MWDKDNTKELIFFYKQHPVLFDLNNRYYHFKSRRNEALEQITQALSKHCSLNVTPEDVEEKIRWLRQKYFAELNKAKKKPNFKSNLWFFEDISFLANYIPGETGSTSQNSSREHIIPVKVEEESSMDDSTADGINTPVLHHLRRSKTNTTSTPEPAMPKNKKRKIDTSEFMDEPMDESQSISLSTLSTEDVLESFAKMIVAELSVIRDKTIIRRVKRRILDLVYHAQEEDEENN